MNKTRGSKAAVTITHQQPAGHMRQPIIIIITIIAIISLWAMFMVRFSGSAQLCLSSRPYVKPVCCARPVLATTACCAHCVGRKSCCARWCERPLPVYPINRSGKGRVQLIFSDTTVRCSKGFAAACETIIALSALTNTSDLK